MAAVATLAAAAVLAAAPAASAEEKRVVSFTPFASNVLAALGVKPIAIGKPPAGEKYLSKKLKGVPRLQLTHPNGPNIELLAATRPDLVLSSPTWRPGTANIQGLGIKVYDNVEPERLATIGLAVRNIGRLVGKPARARKLAVRMNKQIRRNSRKIRKRPRVLVVLGLARYTVALLRNTWAGDVVARAGGRLVTSKLKPLADIGQGNQAANLSNEKVVQLNPEVIIVVPHGRAEDVPSIARYYRGYKPWRKTKASRRGQIYVPTDDQLLQATFNPGRTIKAVRRQFLRNW